MIKTLLSSFGKIQDNILTFLEVDNLQRLECTAKTLNHGAEVDILVKSLLESNDSKLLADVKKIILMTDQLNSPQHGLIRTLFVERNACKILADKLKFLLAVCKKAETLSDVPKPAIKLLPKLLRAIRNLARPDGKGLLKMVDEGVCNTVVSIIKMEILRDEADVHQMGWAACINLAATSFNAKCIDNESGIKLLVQAGACKALISTLQNPAFRSVWAIFENALWALVNISVYDDGEKELVQLGSPELIVNCMRNEHFKTNGCVQEQVLSAVRNLSLSDAGNENLIKAGVCDEAVRLLRCDVLCQRDSLVDQGLSAFANLAGTDAGQSALIKAGALEIVVRVLKQEKYSANIEVCSSVLMAAANLACNTQGQELFAQLGACEAIMAMMRSGKCRTHCGVQENGLLAMGNLAVVDSGQSILLKHDAVGLVMSTLRNERFREALRVHNQGLGVLYNLLWPTGDYVKSSTITHKQIRAQVKKSAELFATQLDKPAAELQLVQDTSHRILALLDANGGGVDTVE